MFATTRDLALKYNYLSEKFKLGYAFLQRDDLASLPDGVVDLGHGVRAIVQSYTTIRAEDGRFEAHNREFDIQYIIEGAEMFGVVDRAGLEEDSVYDEEKDIVFFKEPAESGRLLLRAGDFAVVAPEDAHKPRVMVGAPAAVKKVVVKIPV